MEKEGEEAEEDEVAGVDDAEGVDAESELEVNVDVLFLLADDFISFALA